MMTEVGTATIKVLPDLTEFNELIKAAGNVGLTVTETTAYMYDSDGRPSTVTVQTTYTAGAK